MRMLDNSQEQLGQGVGRGRVYEDGQEREQYVWGGHHCQLPSRLDWAGIVMTKLTFLFYCKKIILYNNN